MLWELKCLINHPDQETILFRKFNLKQTNKKTPAVSELPDHGEEEAI